MMSQLPDEFPPRGDDHLGRAVRFGVIFGSPSCSHRHREPDRDQVEHHRESEAMKPDAYSGRNHVANVQGPRVSAKRYPLAALSHRPVREKFSCKKNLGRTLMKRI